jgi:phage-related holin
MRPFLTEHINELKTAIYLSFIYLNIDTDIVKILMLLMAFDTVSGIMKSWKLLKQFDFKVLFFGLCSKLIILLVPMVLALVSKGISKSYDMSPLLDVVLKVLVVSEGLSTISNFYVFKTGKDVKNIDILTMLLSALRKWMLRFIESIIKKIE